MDLVSAADELYGLPLSGFVAARARLEKEARTSGNRSLAADVHALRKPSQAAWAVNQLVRQAPELLDDVLELGAELGDAQEAGDTAGLRRLTARRHELYAAVRRRAQELVAGDGRVLGGEADRALERTLGAAMADPRVAEVVRSGRLVVDLENAGWGPVDLDGAQAAPTAAGSPEAAGAARDGRARKVTGPKPARQDPAQRRENERREAERALAEARDAATEAAAALERADEALAAATSEKHRLADRRDALLAELREIEAGEDGAARDVRAAREERAAAARGDERAQRLVARSTRQLEELTGAS